MRTYQPSTIIGPTEKTATAILVSGRGSNLQALIDAAVMPDFPARIALVLSDNPGSFGLERAGAAGIPALCVNPRDHAGREGFERALEHVLADYKIDLICLAGFMRILGAGFLAGWMGRVLNIHPSLLPSYKGLDTHRRALADGAALHGCSVHIVIPELDAGPVIIQAQVPVRPDDTPERLAARVLTREHEIYPKALELAAAGRLDICDGRIMIDATRPGPIIRRPLADSA